MTLTLALAAAAALFSLLALAAVLWMALEMKRERAGGDDRLDDALDAVMGEVNRAKQDLLQQQAASGAQLSQSMSGFMRYASEVQDRAVQAQSQSAADARGELQRMTEAIHTQFRSMQGMVDARFAKVLEANAGAAEGLGRQLGEALDKVRADNAQKLEAMRATVQEKLDRTLSERLQASFRTVDEKLGLVQTGLGEMRRMAESVSKLQGVLANVKTRGMFGETQLSAILSDLFSPSQFAEQARIIPGRAVAVDFALKLPGRGSGPCWLPIDSKFPLEDWEALQAAETAADAAAAAEARKALERALLRQAKSIAEKYICPPYTTDFAVMFLPSEGLYAEAVRTPALLARLQSEFHVTPAGPVVISALLNSLLVGFMTLAMEKRSADVWRILGDVKAEFSLFEKQFAAVERKFRETQSSLEAMGTRARLLEKRMRQVEALSEDAEDSAKAAAELASPDAFGGAADGFAASTAMAERAAEPPLLQTAADCPPPPAGELRG